MDEDELQRIESFANCDPPCEACKTTRALTGEVRRLRSVLQRIRLRHEAEDTGQGFVRGEVAWAMWQDAVETLEKKGVPDGEGVSSL